jgi:hypothetical protein
MKKPPARPAVALGVAAVSLKALAVLLMVATPLAGVWVASSLAAYASGPMWAAIGVGAFLFPIAPAGWELVARTRRSRAVARGKKVREPILTTTDRLVLRTLAVNAVFLVALLATHPETAFAALATRGDWMLDGRDGSGVTTARTALHRAANGLAWLYEAAHDNPYRDLGGEPEPPPPPPRSTGGALTVWTSSPPIAPSGAPDPKPTPSDTAEPAPLPVLGPSDKPSWPLPASLHPAVASVPAEAEASIDSLGAYLREREPNPFLRAKAVHDWVADRVAYDVPAYRNHTYPPQDAATVFRTHVAVCAGYSRLFVELAKKADLDAVYVTGDARTRGDEVRGEGHAWNAVKLDGEYYLVDTTWDSGSVDGDTFTKSLRADYLFPPAEVFGLTHFPDEKGWQLRDPALDRGEFFRQPMMTPGFYAAGMKLVDPTRSQIDARGSVTVRALNPRGAFLMAHAKREGGERGDPCAVTSDLDAAITCPVPGHGRYDVELFLNSERYGTYAYAGQVVVNASE